MLQPQSSLVGCWLPQSFLIAHLMIYYSKPFVCTVIYLVQIESVLVGCSTCLHGLVYASTWRHAHVCAPQTIDPVQRHASDLHASNLIHVHVRTHLFHSMVCVWLSCFSFRMFLCCNDCAICGMIAHNDDSLTP